ncbi:MAG TPA: reverse transcriptase domain-containing protein, partial [Candidatus Acidoferrum sp.]|nr:reverse transcriptase domain-containing protein [Candidatus Acidoferrum sp.]
MTTAALLREAQLDAGADHEQRLAAEPFPLWSNASYAINVLPLKTEIKHGVSASPSRNCSFKLEITFCVRGVISPALSNITLDGLERRLREVFPVRGKGSERGRAAQVHLIRYADDFIITGHSEELLRMTVKPLVESFLAERGLVLSSEKTLITHIEKGFDFLGQNIRRYPHGKLLIKPARKSVVSVLAKVKQIVREYLGSTAHLLINRLNPIVRGWANYHRHVVSKRV